MKITKTNSVKTDFEEIKPGTVFSPIEKNSGYYIKISKCYDCNAIHLRSGMLAYFEPEEQILTGKAEFLVDF